jgi:hypothetical protein
MKKLIFLSALILSLNVSAKDVIGIIKEIKPFYSEKYESISYIPMSYGMVPTLNTPYISSLDMEKFLDSLSYNRVEDKKFKMITLEAEDKTIYTVKTPSEFDVKVGEKVKINIENL